jgi:hypothetical protein
MGERDVMWRGERGEGEDSETGGNSRPPCQSERELHGELHGERDEGDSWGKTRRLGGKEWEGNSRATRSARKKIYVLYIIYIYIMLRILRVLGDPTYSEKDIWTISFIYIQYIDYILRILGRPGRLGNFFRTPESSRGPTRILTL